MRLLMISVIVHFTSFLYNHKKGFIIKKELTYKGEFNKKRSFLLKTQRDKYNFIIDLT